MNYQIYALFIITYAIGYMAGYISKPKVIENILSKPINNIVHKAQDIVDKPLQPGIYKRPSAQQLYIKHEEPEKKAATEAMKATLDAIPELQKAKQDLEFAKNMGLL